MDNITVMDTRKRRKEGSSRTPSLECLQASPKRARVHAQRKFAQGSQPNSPAPTPVKETRELRDRSNSAETRSRTAAQPHSTPPSPLDIVEVPMRPTVEDFLTFLCYRGTPLLPPELEHFNTPQLLETAGDSRSQSPTRDDKVKAPTKRKQDGLVFDKKDKELSKETVKKNLDQSTDIEDYDATPSVRITRSSTQLPLVATASSPGQPSPQKASKRLMIKKALILRSKAKTLRIQDRRDGPLRKIDNQMESSMHGVTATRSGRLLHKYRGISATTAMARKKAKVAKLSSMRPKQKRSRILQRLGGSVSNPDTKLPRITRSQVEPKEASNVESSPELTQSSESEKSSPCSDGSREANPETPKVTRSLRLLRQQPDGKKVIVKKVLRVGDKGKSSKQLNSSSKSLSSSLSSSPESEEHLPVSRRLRKKSTTPVTNPESSVVGSPTSNTCEDGGTTDTTTEPNSPAKSKSIDDREKNSQKSSVDMDLSPLAKKAPNHNNVNCDQKKPNQTEKPTPSKLSVDESPSHGSESSPSKVQKHHFTRRTSSSAADTKASVDAMQNTNSSLELKQPNSDDKSKGSCVNIKSESQSKKEEGSLSSEKSTGIAKSTTSRNVRSAVKSEAVKDSSKDEEKSELIVEEKSDSRVDLSSGISISHELFYDNAKKDLKVAEKPVTRAKQKECVSQQTSHAEGKSPLRTSGRRASLEAVPSLASDKKSSEGTRKEENMEVVLEKVTIDTTKLANVTSVKVALEKKLSPQQEESDNQLLSTPPTPDKDLMLEKKGNSIEVKDKVSKDPELVAVKSKSSSAPSTLESDVKGNPVQEQPPTSKLNNTTKVGSSTPKIPMEVPLDAKEAAKSTPTRASQRKASSDSPSPGVNRKAVGSREARRSKEIAGEEPAAPRETRRSRETSADEEISSDTGVRTRPSRRTKEAATVYLELIGRKLAKESKPKSHLRGEESGDEDDDDDAVSVSSIMDLKDLAKSKGIESEKERKEKLSSWKIESCEPVMENPDDSSVGDKPQTSTNVSVRSSTRKSPRQKRDINDQVTEEEKVSASASSSSKRRLSKEEIASPALDDKHSPVNKVKRKLEREVPPSLEKDEDKKGAVPESLSPSPQKVDPSGGQSPLVTARAGSRNLRRTQSDAEEPRRRGSRPSSRRSSLELDTLSGSTKQKLGIKGRQSVTPDDKSESGVVEGRTLSNALSVLNDPKTGKEDEEKMVLASLKNDSNEKCTRESNAVISTEKENLRKMDVDNSIDKGLCEKKQARVSSKFDIDSQEKGNGVESDKSKVVSSEVAERVPKSSPSVSKSHEKVSESDSVAPIITGKTHRTVLQDRKIRKNVAKDEGRSVSRRQSLEILSENGQSQVGVKLSGRGKAGITSTCGENGSNDMEERKSVRPNNKQKLVGGRRRSSNHDEAKLNEVLESVAKDFEKDIDEDHYDQIEKDFALGNKSPEKGISEKMIDISEKEDSNLTEFISFCMDDKVNNVDAFGLSGENVKSQTSGPTPQPGSSSPNLIRRSANSKKLSDVVRNLQKKQAESPSLPSGPTESPTFLKDLNTWNSDKLRQVSPQSGSFHIESPNTSSAPKVIAQNDASSSMPESLHSPSSHATQLPSPFPPSPSAPAAPPPQPPSAPAPVSPTTLPPPPPTSVPSSTPQPSAPPPQPPPTSRPEVVPCKAPSLVPDKTLSSKVAVTKSPCVGLAPHPTSSPATSHSSSSVVTVTTSCLQASAPYTAVTFSANYNVVHTSTSTLGTPTPTPTPTACDIPSVSAVSSKSLSLKSFQPSKDDQVTVLSTIPVVVGPSPIAPPPPHPHHPSLTAVNVMNSGFSPTVTTVPSLPKLTSGMTLSPHGSPSSAVACAKTLVELSTAPTPKMTPKPLHIAPKPSKSAAPLVSSPATNSISLGMPQGTVKQTPKPVQIAPKPPPPPPPAPGSATHVHPNSSRLATPHQPTAHLMHAQVQTPMQALPQVQTPMQAMPHPIQGMKAIPQAMQTIPTAAAALPQPVQNMQALPQTVQTMQAIPQPVQNMHTIPQAVQTVPQQAMQTVQTLAPPMQTVTGMPVQAVVTQTLINPTHIMTPSSPARIMNHPVFATSSNQSTVTYTLAPQPITQSQLQTNVGTVARVLTPAVVGAVATKPQSNLMTPKAAESLVTLTPGNIASVGGVGTVRPIAPLPPQVQVTQPQILAVNVVPVVSTTMVGQSGLIARPQGPTTVVTSCPAPTGNHSYVATTSSLGIETIPPNTHTTLAYSQQPVPLPNTSNSYAPPSAVVAASTYPSLSSGVAVDNPQHLTNNPQNLPGNAQVVTCNVHPTNINQSAKPLMTSDPQSIRPVRTNKVNTNCLPTPVTLSSQGTTMPAKSVVEVPMSIENSRQFGTVDRRFGCASAANSAVKVAFKGNVPPGVKITEAARPVAKVNGPPVPATNVRNQSRIPAGVKSQIHSSSITITTLGEVSQSSANNRVASTMAQVSPSPEVSMKLPPGVSVSYHKTGPSHTVSKTPVPAIVATSSSVSQTNESAKAINNVVPASTQKNRRVVPSYQQKDDIYSSFIATSGPRFSRERANPVMKNDGTTCHQQDSQSSNDSDIAIIHTVPASTIKNKLSQPFSLHSQEGKALEKSLQTASDKTQVEFDKRTADKRKEPLLKRTLFKTKSHEERRPTNPSPLYRTKSQDEKKPSGAFSPLHESSVYAFDEPDLEPSPIEVSPFSQRIRNIQSSPGTSPVKPNNAVKPPSQSSAACKPLGKGSTPALRGHVARSITPLVMGKNKSDAVVSVNVPQQTVISAKKPPSSPKGVSTSTDTGVGVSKLDASAGVNTEQKTNTQSGQSSSENIKKNTNSTSIAIQCDMDENIAEEPVRANESGTQTEGPSKFPLPPSASPFYYLPLAMAALGEKLPAQLVQQMLAKTQGLVGAAEAGMILQQAAQLAQQHQQKLSQGTPGPCLPASSAVKPIKGASVAPLISGIAGNLCVSNAAALKSSNKSQETTISSGDTSTPSSSPSTTDAKTTTTNSSSTVTVSSSTSVTVTSSSSVTAPSQMPSAPVVTTISSSCVSSTLTTSSVPETNSNTDPPLPPIPSHRLESTVTPTTATPPSEEVGPPPAVEESKPEPKPRKRKCEATKSQSEETPPLRRRSGRATTLAATKATESDMQEIEELRRNRRAKRAAAALAKEEGWSSSSEAPLSPQMSPDTLRGWPPPRLTSPTPSQSSEGTTSSTPSQRGNRLSASRSRRQSPASNFDTRSHPSSFTSNSCYQASNSSMPATPDKHSDDSVLQFCDNSLLVRAPSFYPSEEEFSDPLDYIEKIRPEAEQFGLCRIVPPSSFKPECRVNDDMRFTSNNQYIHKMMKRWGPNVRTLRAIKKCLSRQNIELNSNPLIGCTELDLVRLYEVVEQHGGLMSVIEKDMWGKIADTCRIPRSAQERLAKLDSIYCKYLLPYATLSQDERAQLLAEVDAMHSRNRGEPVAIGKRTSSVTSDAEEEDEEESLDCIVKGKSTALSTFYRVARNISNQWQPDPSGLEMEERYWSVIVNGTHHVCVLSASIDTSEHAYGFPNLRNSPLAKHPWNLKNLCQNTNSVLRSMGTIVGVTAPTLHVGMLFSTVCWYRDPHGLPWIEYLHTGASKIWYGVAANQEEKLCAALKKIVPDFIKDSALWLPSDTAMVPPTELVREGVRVCRVVQDPGQFVVVFPGAFTSSVCKGYLISESAFFARPQYFDRAVPSFKALHDCCEPSMFSLDRLVLSVVSDPRATLDGLLRARDLVLEVVQKEKKLRSQLADIGLETSERLSTPDSHRKKKSRFIEDEEENMCEVCRQHLYVALVTNSQEEAVYCLEHALVFLSKNPSHLEFCKLMYTYSLSELDSAIKQMDERIHAKSGSKKSPFGKKAKSREHLDSFSSTSSSNL